MGERQVYSDPEAEARRLEMEQERSRAVHERNRQIQRAMGLLGLGMRGMVWKVLGAMMAQDTGRSVKIAGIELPGDDDRGEETRDDFWGPNPPEFAKNQKPSYFDLPENREFFGKK